MTKTIITQSWLTNNGFASGTFEYADGTKLHQYTNGNMVFEFGASNIPVLRRKKKNYEVEYLGGYETWEEAAAVFFAAECMDTELELRGTKIFKAHTNNSVGETHVQRNYEAMSFKPLTDVESEIYAKLFAQSPKLLKWATRRYELMEKVRAAGLLDDAAYAEYEELKNIINAIKS